MNIKDFPPPHIPCKLPLDTISNKLACDKSFISNIIRKGSRLSEFIGYLQNLPSPQILISSLTLQEAVLSSRIEGTLATIADVVTENRSSETMANDIIEIENYCKAIHYGHLTLRDHDALISKNMICQLHILLLDNDVRGADKTPGIFKTEQNFIQNDILGNFTPLPPVLTDEYMDNLIEYIRADSEISELVQAAVMHAQFEMIHPFKDGNGRVGRLLIPLLLFYKKVLPFPIFYISRYFAENNDTYKKYLAALSRASSKEEQISAWRDWLYFFFDGVATESTRHISTSRQIIDLYKEMSAAVNKTAMIPLVDLLFEQLKISPPAVISSLQLPASSVYKVLANLTEKKYLTRTGSERKSLYVFTKILDIVQ